METLEEIRAKIDEVDEEMAKLFARRLELTRKAALIKRAQGLPAEDPGREVQILERGAAIFEGAAAEAQDGAAREDYLRFQKTVIQISKDAQKR